MDTIPSVRVHFKSCGLVRVIGLYQQPGIGLNSSESVLSGMLELFAGPESGKLGGTLPRQDRI
jgi:hypothetical protein